MANHPSLTALSSTLAITADETGGHPAALPTSAGGANADHDDDAMLGGLCLSGRLSHD